MCKTLVIIQIILMSFTFYTLRRKLYGDMDFTKRIKIPIYAYLLFGVLGIIPILGMIMWLVVNVWILFSIIEQDIYYKKGKIVTFLTKDI